jgi:hypothetical protein
MTICDKEVARLLSERAERARLQCPNTGEYIALLKICFHCGLLFRDTPDRTLLL